VAARLVQHHDIVALREPRIAEEDAQPSAKRFGEQHVAKPAPRFFLSSGSGAVTLEQLVELRLAVAE
jgi:hypothetical protein